MSAHVVTREAYALDLRQYAAPCQRNHRHCSRLAALLVAAGLPEPEAYAATNRYSDRSYLRSQATVLRGSPVSALRFSRRPNGLICMGQQLASLKLHCRTRDSRI